MTDEPKKLIRHNKGWDNLIPAKPGEVRNPKGRPRGSRSKFSELFFQDMLMEWQEGGKEAIAKVRLEDPATFLRVAASIPPKEFSLNEGESTLERILEQYSTGELDKIATALSVIGAAHQGGEGKKEEGATGEPGSVH